MAPTASHEQRWTDSIPYIRSLFDELSSRSRNEGLQRRADSGPSNQVASYTAAIAILSAIIGGYLLYRLIKFYLAHRRGKHRTYPNRYKKGNRISEIAIPDANYSHIAPLATGRSNEHLALSPSSQFLPPLSSAGLFPSPSTSSIGNTGMKTPRLEWRPPTFTPWSKSFKGSRLDRDAELGRTQDTGSDAVAFPAQTYSEQGKLREKIAMVKSGFGFGKSKLNKETEAYLMMNGSPPVGSPPPQYAKNHENSSNHVVNVRANGAISPPLPPLPPAPFIPPPPKSEPPPMSNDNTIPAVSQEAPSSAMAAAEGSTADNSAPMAAPDTVKRTQSRPPSRAPTVKGSRLTSTTIASHSGRISTVILGPTPNPSPRVSSLYHARNSSHSYTPASPGLPNPLPPLPALPAHLLGRTPSVKSAHTKKESLGSVTERTMHEHNNSAHNNAFSPVSAPSNSTISPIDPAKGLDGKPLPRTMVVTATFTPSLSDELPLAIGETVSMLEEYIDGWCFVQRVKIVVKPGSSGVATGGDITVSVHGTVEVSNTIAVAVEGEGNSGAVPRFCVSEWPLSPTTIAQMQEGTTIAGLSPHQEFVEEEKDKAPGPFRHPSPLSFLPSVHIDPETAAKITSPISNNPPPTSFLPVTSQAGGAQPLDSKFSSWGSVATAPAPATGIMANSTSKETSSPPQIGALPTHAPINAFQSSTSGAASFKPSLLNPKAAGRTQPPTANPVQPISKKTSLVVVADSDPDSRVTSANSEASYAPPVPPPTSPVSVQQPSPEGSDDVKLVSKPPPAPRLSRFPSPEKDVAEESETFPRVPKASERTMTMPPLARGVTVEALVNAQSQQPSNTSAAKPISTPWSSDGGLARADSTASTAMGSNMGTSAGFKTPSTAQTASSDLSSKSMSKRYTSAVQVPGSGGFGGANSFSGRSGASTAANSNVGIGGRPIGIGGNQSTFGPRAKPGGPGVVSFKSLRTGSATAGVAMGSLAR